MEVTEPKSVNSDFIDTLSHFGSEASEWLILYFFKSEIDMNNGGLRGRVVKL